MNVSLQKNAWFYDDFFEKLELSDMRTGWLTHL
jgi:hypothetical protein